MLDQTIVRLFILGLTLPFHYDDEKCYELNDSYKVSFDKEDAIALLRDYIMEYDQEQVLYYEFK